VADIGDVALKETEVHDNAALSVHRSRNGIETPEYRGTRRICLGCKKPIPERQLVAEPNAVRCVPCQATHDEKEKRGEQWKR